MIPFDRTEYLKQGRAEIIGNINALKLGQQRVLNPTTRQSVTSIIADKRDALNKLLTDMQLIQEHIDALVDLRSTL